jgi:hypothetical protein
MDSDSTCIKKCSGEELPGCIEYKEKNSDAVPVFGNVFQSVGIRRAVQDGNGVHERLLDYEFAFLPLVAVVLWFLYFLVWI